MAFGNSTFSNVAGAVGDIFGGQSTAASLRLRAQGDLAEAGNYDLAADLARRNRDFTATSTAIKTTQAQRQEYMGIGALTSDVAGAGFTMSGTALDLLRDSMSQGALTRQVITQQGLMTEAGQEEQAQAYANMAYAARQAAASEESMASSATRNSLITGGIKGLAGLATLFI